MIIISRISEKVVVSSAYATKEWSFIYNEGLFDTLKDLEVKSRSIRNREDLEKVFTTLDQLSNFDYNAKLESIHPNLTVSQLTGQFYLKLDNVIDTVPMPVVYGEFIRQTIDKDLDPTPIIKAWIRWRRNPKSNDEHANEQFAKFITMTFVVPADLNKHLEAGLPYDIAIELASTYEVKITQEGLLVAYKSVREVQTKFVADEDGNPKEVSRYTKKFNGDTGELEGDNRDDFEIEDRLFIPHIQQYSGDPFTCKGSKGYGDKQQHFVKVGCEIALDSWDKVDTNDNNSCVKGLHIGGLSYLNNWKSDEILTCFVDPANIGAICDYNGFWAMRVLKYYVYGSLKTISKNLYLSSDYAELSDADWKESLSIIFTDVENMTTEINKDLNFKTKL